MNQISKFKRLNYKSSYNKCGKAHNIGFVNDFQDMGPKILVTKENIEYLDFINIKNFVPQRIL